MGGRNWYVIQCKARESFRAAENLENQGYTVYHPCLEVEKKRHGKLVRIEEPLFPYYLFIYLNDVTDNWRPLRSTRGVLKLVSFGQQPLQVSDELVTALRERLAPQPQDYLKPGDAVLIEEGPFQGLNAIFQKKRGEERVLVLLEILHKQQRLEVPVSAIRPL